MARWVDVQDVASRGADESSGGGQDPQSHPFRFVAGGRVGQREAGAPGQQISGERGDGDPDPVLVGVMEGQVAQPGVLRRADAVLDAGVAAVAQFEVGELGGGAAAGGVGEEPGDAQPVAVGDPQLRARVRAFLAQDQPRPGRPAAQRDQVGGFGDPGAVAGLDLHAGLGGARAAGLIRRCPRPLRDRRQRGRHVEVGEAGPDRELHTLGLQVRGELLRGAGGVGAHQHRHLPRLVAGPQHGGELGQCGVEHDDVIGGGVRPGLTRSQQLRDRFPTRGPAVIDKGQQRVEPEALLPGSSGVLLL